MKWKVIDSGFLTCSENMAIDERLLRLLKTDPQPILRFYEWTESSATYGYFTDPSKYLKKNSILNIAKRPTGGGLLFHLWDFTFSIFIPAGMPFFSFNTLQNYQYVNEKISQSIEKTTGKRNVLLQSEEPCENAICQNFCMAKPTLNDVMLDNKKVAGGAQRRTRHGFIHQGSISLVVPDYNFLEEILIDSQIIESMKNKSSYLIDESSPFQLHTFKKELKNVITNSFLE